MRRFLTLLAALLLAPATVCAQDVSAVTADPPRDAANPAGLAQVRYPTAGVAVPARFFLASGAGKHGTVLLLHGFPGTELNLDLARAMQRAGWNVLAIHYRGVWGAPGKFSLAHTVEDSRAALAWLRTPEVAAKYRVDTGKLVVLGHSMGGFDAVMLGDDAKVAGFVTISAWDVAGTAEYLDTPAKRVANAGEFTDELSYTNASYTELADEIVVNRALWDWKSRAAKLAGRPALVLSSDDGNGPNDDAIAAAIVAAGGPAPTRVKFVTDHSYNDHRVALATAIVDWLGKTF